MADTIKGVVTDIRDVKGAYGVMYSMVVNDTFYGTGKVRPDVPKGAYISFNAEQKGKYWNADVGSIKVLEETPKTQVATPEVRKAYGGKSPEEQKTVSRQAARNTAIAWIEILAAQNALVFPKTAKEGDRHEILDEMLEYYTNNFFDYSQNGAVTKPTTTAAAEAPADEAWQDK